jgi:pimeloyl-ACP methyl ester carboxylesterase
LVSSRIVAASSPEIRTATAVGGNTFFRGRPGLTSLGEAAKYPLRDSRVNATLTPDRAARPAADPVVGLLTQPHLALLLNVIESTLLVTPAGRPHPRALRPVPEGMSIRGRAAVSAACGAVAIAASTALLSAAPGQAYATDIYSSPVSFDVVTSNDSGLPCATLPPAPQHVTVHGHLTGPAGKLDSDGVHGTLYSHGDGYDETFWRYRGDARYDYVDDMSRRGHVSVTIDRLGYGSSDKPNGNTVCFGTEASVLHQIIGQLRAGSYRGDRTPRFDRVGLVGHSASGIIAEQEAAGFHDIDALGVLSSGELTATPLVLQRATEQQLRCLTAPDGYAGLEADTAQFRADHLYNVEPKIADDLAAHRTEDACAGTRNAAQAIVGNPARNNLITVPVLVMAGANDPFFPHPARQAATFSRSEKVTVHEIPETGHAIAFARTAPLFRDDMNHWLDDAAL